MKIQLKGREIPRNAGGDPHFVCLGPLVQPREYSECPICRVKGDHQINTVINQFSPDEIVELVNRALYQLEYQHNAHKVRGQAQRDREKRVREKVKELFHTSWMKATPDQIRKATEEVEKG